MPAKRKGGPDRPRWIFYDARETKGKIGRRNEKRERERERERENKMNLKTEKQDVCVHRRKKNYALVLLCAYNAD